MSSKKYIFFLFCMYKMYLISAEVYENANFHYLPQIGISIKSQIWISIKDVKIGMGVKNISDWENERKIRKKTKTEIRKLTKRQK